MAHSKIILTGLIGTPQQPQGSLGKINFKAGIAGRCDQIATKNRCGGHVSNGDTGASIR